MATATTKLQQKSGMQRMLDGIERVGNKVPHPVLMFLYLIIGVIILSHILYVLGVSVTEEIAVPIEVDTDLNFYEDTTEPIVPHPTDPYGIDYEIQQQTIGIRSLLTTEGIRFVFT